MRPGAAVLLLGAEKQAATSFALAYPELAIRGLTDQVVVDGWDIPNLTLQRARPETRANALDAITIPLCARWIQPVPLSHALPALSRRFGQHVLPVSRTPPPDKPWVAKGDAWHKPDALVWGSGVEELRDPYGCGIVFQERVEPQETILAMGRRNATGGIGFGLVRVLRENFAREDYLGAGETLRDLALEELTLEMVRELELDGFFTLNWLRTKAGVRLSSVRPIARSLFQTFRADGLDLMSLPSSGTLVARGQRRFVIEIHYSSYHPL